MKHFLLLLLAVMSVTACGTARRVSADPMQPWLGHSTAEILATMGEPDRIDPDGQGGSILVYEPKPDYTSPDYDILDPDADAVRTREYAKFYLDREGDCYFVETNRNLPSPKLAYTDDWGGFWIDVFVSLPLLFIGLLL